MVDAPQQWQPSTITELYDDQNRVIGQFALQRRVIDKYDDFPKILRDAITSTEDKDFERHWGVDVWRAGWNFINAYQFQWKTSQRELVLNELAAE